jgi:hypothetical protein
MQSLNILRDFVSSHEGSQPAKSTICKTIDAMYSGVDGIAVLRAAGTAMGMDEASMGLYGKIVDMAEAEMKAKAGVPK